MSEPNPESTTTPLQTSTETTGSTSLSGSTSRISGNWGGNNNRNGNSYGRSKGKQSIMAVTGTDRDFKAKIETIGVLGLPSEKQLKFGLSYEDFQESLMQYSAANLKKGNNLKLLIKFL
eukprot:11211825-Ditylum_brightwellii.AAC.1